MLSDSLSDHGESLGEETWEDLQYSNIGKYFSKKHGNVYPPKWGCNNHFPNRLKGSYFLHAQQDASFGLILGNEQQEIE